MDLQEVGRGGMDRIYMARDEDRWRNLVNFRVSKNSANLFLE
jgi:hypothetical protein